MFEINIITLAIIEFFLLILIFFISKFSKKSWIKESLFNFKIKCKKPLLTIVLPSILSLILVLIYSFVFKKIEAYPASLWLLIITAVIIAPLTEEIFLRGILLGYVVKMSEYTQTKIGKIIFIGIGFIIQLALFVFLHQRLEWQNLSILIVSGALYSSLFLIYKKNLLPSIIAHSATNLFVILFSLL